KNVLHALEIPIADAPRAVEFMDEIVDRAFVLGHGFRNAAAMQIANRRRRDAGALSLRHMRKPLVLRPPQLRRYQDGELGQPWWDRRLVAAMAAKLLGELAERRRM